MPRTIDRIFYNPVENSSRGHPPYPSEISTLYPPPTPLGISINHPWGGGGYGYFLESHNLPFSYNGYLHKMPLFVVSFEFCQTFDVFCPKIISWFSFNLSWFSFNCWHKCIVSDGGCSLPFPHWSGLKRYPQVDMVALPRLQ